MTTTRINPGRASRLRPAIALAALAIVSMAHPATVSPGDPEPGDPAGDGGIGYEWTVTLGANDSTGGAIKGTVGAWSWEDNSLFAPGDPSVGWTHTSQWVAILITGSDPAVALTIRMAREAGILVPGPGGDTEAPTDSLFPSFTLWAGWDNDGIENHTYQNREPGLYPDAFWAEDLTYLGHLDNSTEAFAERTFVLAPGQYTLVMGSNAPATDPNRQGFLTTLTTVPEPGAGVLGLSALGLAARRRRR